jgi:hypothetical protein
MPARYIMSACALLLAGCAVNHAQGRSPITAPTSDAQLCAVQSWPRPLPAVTGLDLTQAADGALTCFDRLRALAPDGHDVMTDHGRAASAGWTITAMTPPAGTRVGHSDTITLSLAPSDTSAAPAFHPCDWASDKALAILDASAVTALPTGDQAGSVDQACDYKSPSGMVTTELKSPGSFAVGARSEFNELTAVGRGSELTGLSGRAYCGVTTNGGKTTSELMVLLSEGRAYHELGWNGQSCKLLKRFAQAALAHIPA